VAIVNASKKIGSLSVEKLREWMAGRKESDLLLLDVRQPQEYMSGHIPGAALIPLPELIDKAGELDPAVPVLAYCRIGNRSRAAAAFLLSEGFSRVYSLEGGITAWNGHVATGSYSEGLFLLQGRETAEELIALAAALEEGSRAFYTEAGALTSHAEAKKILNMIAEAEAKHKATVLQAYRSVVGDAAEGTLKEESLQGFMEGGVRIEDAIGFLKEKGKTLLDIIEVSMQVETNALDLYMKILRAIEDANARTVFGILIKEEKQHLSRLGDLLGGRAA
jgi:rhodanese-related sulfurtransferase/rubrerythrin